MKIDKDSVAWLIEKQAIEESLKGFEILQRPETINENFFEIVSKRDLREKIIKKLPKGLREKTVLALASPSLLIGNRWRILLSQPSTIEEGDEELTKSELKLFALESLQDLDLIVADDSWLDKKGTDYKINQRRLAKLLTEVAKRNNIKISWKAAWSSEFESLRVIYQQSENMAQVIQALHEEERPLGILYLDELTVIDFAKENNADLTKGAIESIIYLGPEKLLAFAGLAIAEASIFFDDGP
jgi:hypothetical protein